MTVHIWE